jgi:hypothetical protein
VAHACALLLWWGSAGACCAVGCALGAWGCLAVDALDEKKDRREPDFLLLLCDSRCAFQSRNMEAFLLRKRWALTMGAQLAQALDPLAEFIFLEHAF